MSELLDEENIQNQIRILLNVLDSSSPRVRDEILYRLIPHVGVFVRPIGLERKVEQKEKSIEEKVVSIENRMSIFENKLIEIEKHLKIGVDYQPVNQFKDFISKISEVKAVFYRETDDGYDFWTLFESEDRFKTLQKIVKAQIELDKSHKNTLFDFNIDHIANVDNEELESWIPLYIRKIR